MSNQSLKNTTKLYKRQNGKCYYCKRVMLSITKRQHYISTLQSFPPLTPTFDHIILKKDGGTKRLSNGVCACYQCNSFRGNVSFKAFKFIITSANQLEFYTTKFTNISFGQIANKTYNQINFENIQDFNTNPQYI